MEKGSDLKLQIFCTKLILLHKYPMKPFNTRLLMIHVLLMIHDCIVNDTCIVNDIFIGNLGLVNH